MKNLMLLSTEPYSGKTGLVINLIRDFRDRGRETVYFKPVGNLPVMVNSTICDRDALFAKESLGLEDSLEKLCPEVLTSEESLARLRGMEDGVAGRIKSAFASVARDGRLAIIEGSGHINDGRLHHVSALELIDAMNAKAVLVVKLDNTYELVDDILVAADRFRDRLAGIIFNWVRPGQENILSNDVVPYLEAHGVTTFGIIPRDPGLLAVSVDTLSKALGGRFLCGADHADNMVETFMVGAMGQEQALRFFRHKTRKAVVTGGDRADVQLAALETPTSCLVLTGNYPPPPAILTVAESKHVPVILVEVDTLTAVERTEALIGQTRVHDRYKLEEIGQRMKEFVDMERLYEVTR
jgi:BioD-like phosphotransacetylase family protein